MTDLVIALNPESTGDLRQRAAFLIEMKRYGEAADTLDRYLALASEQEDTADLKQTALNLRKTVAQMN